MLASVQTSTLLRILFYPLLITAASLFLALGLTFVYTTARYYVGLHLNKHAPGKVSKPVKIPFTLPFLGHALDFLGKEPGSFWVKLFRWHSRATGACTLHLGGRTMHILYNPQVTEALFKSREPARDQANVDIVTKAFGATLPEALKYYGFGEPGCEKFNGRTPKAETERINTEYLMKMDRVNELTNEFTRVFRQQLAAELQSEGEVLESGLYSWLRPRMFRASADALFGETMMQDCPTLEPDFFDFDSSFLDCYFGVPRWVNAKPYEIRARLLDDITRHLELNIERTKGTTEDPDGPVAWERIQGARVNRARQIYYEARELQIRTRAVLDLGMLFGISSNAIPACGWMLMHVLDPAVKESLYPRVLEEVLAARRSDGTFDLPQLMNSPLLLSILHETWRLYSDVLVTREMPKDMTFPMGNNNEKVILGKDSMVLAPSWLGHRDEHSWPNANTFFAERWLVQDEETGKEKFSTVGAAGKFFPFGGGKTICPGRIFAKQEILISFAIVLAEFDIEGLEYLDSTGKTSQKFPQLAPSYPGSGTIVPSGDVKIRIKRRS